MRKTIFCLVCCAIVSFVALCGTGALVLWDLHSSYARTLSKIDLELDEAHRLTLEAGLTAMEARKASAKESAYLDQWNRGISETVSDVHGVMGATQSTIAAIQHTSDQLTTTLETTQETVQALQAPIEQADTTLAALQPVISHLDDLVTSPDITGTLSHVESTAGHVDATAADIQQEVHSLTHPTIVHKAWGIVLDVARVFNPL